MPHILHNLLSTSNVFLCDKILLSTYQAELTPEENKWIGMVWAHFPTFHGVSTFSYFFNNDTANAALVRVTDSKISHFVICGETANGTQQHEHIDSPIREWKRVKSRKWERHSNK